MKFFFLEATSNVSIPAKRKKLPEILDGKFYTVVLNNNGKIVAKCVDCGDIKKGDLSSTGNFESHYKTHPHKSKQLDNYLKDKSIDGNTSKPTLYKKLFTIIYLQFLRAR